MKLCLKNPCKSICSILLNLKRKRKVKIFSKILCRYIFCLAKQKLKNPCKSICSACLNLNQKVTRSFSKIKIPKLNTWGFLLSLSYLYFIIKILCGSMGCVPNKTFALFGSDIFTFLSEVFTIRV